MLASSGLSINRNGSLCYTHDQLIDLHTAAWLLDDDVIATVRSLFRRRGYRSGRQVKLKAIQPRLAFNVDCADVASDDGRYSIATIVGDRSNQRSRRSRVNSSVARLSAAAAQSECHRCTRSQSTVKRSTTVRSRVLVDVKTTRHAATSRPIINKPPTLYVLNIAAITKAHAVEHLAADLTGYNVDIAVVVETHLKKKHGDHNFSIDGFSLFHRDRDQRRGGGVVVYVKSQLSAEVWTCPGDTHTFELLWVRVQTDRHDLFIGAVYHPPKPIYRPAALHNYIEAAVDVLTATNHLPTIILAGDFNALDDSELISRNALTSIVNRPTHGDNYLDQIYVNDLSYASVRVVESTVKTDHKAVIAYSGPQLQLLNKWREQRMFRCRSPTQHALFLEHASQMNIELEPDADVQTNFDIMYDIMCSVLDRFYPEREITLTSSDPHYVTPLVKAMLRKKNRLMRMRAGRLAEADALAARVRKSITRQSSKWLHHIDTKTSAKDAWAKVREVIRGASRCSDRQIDGITAQVLNDHYAAISTDNDYRAPAVKSTVYDCSCFITETSLFRILDTLRPTAAGLDAIPAWFLRLGAAVFAPLAQLFNQSVADGVVPHIGADSMGAMGAIALTAKTWGDARKSPPQKS